MEGLQSNRSLVVFIERGDYIVEHRQGSASADFLKTIHRCILNALPLLRTLK